MPNTPKEPVILITNDDGIHASGLRHLAASLIGLGRLVVVAPYLPNSGMSHAITINSPLRLAPSTLFSDLGIEAWECSGTPVDCVKIARNLVLGFRPTICVSGINHGSNASVNVVYSGTMSAAMEASLEGIPAAGFSLLDFSPKANFRVAQIVTRVTVKKMLQHPQLPANLLLNINIPAVAKRAFKGIKVCRQAKAHWREHFEERKDPYNRSYYWMTGELINPDSGEDTDLWALEQGYASIVPICTDLTHEANRDWLTHQLQF